MQCSEPQCNFVRFEVLKNLKLTKKVNLEPQKKTSPQPQIFETSNFMSNLKNLTLLFTLVELDNLLPYSKGLEYLQT